MSAWKCSKCHRLNKNDGNYCMYCGEARQTGPNGLYRQNELENRHRNTDFPPRTKKKTMGIIIAGIALLFVVVLISLMDEPGGGTDNNPIVQVIAANQFSLGLRKDGSIAYAGSPRYSYLSSWKSIQTIYSGFARRKNGSYVSYNRTEMNLPSTKTVVNITGSSSGNYVALMSDGTVLSTPDDDPYAVDQFGYNLWSELGSYNPRGLAFGSDSHFLLKQDGTVLCWPASYRSDDRFRQIASWKNIKQLAMDGDAFLPVGLQKDGTVVAVTEDYPDMDVAGWSNVIKLFAFDDITAGLRSDGRVLATGGPWGYSSIAREISRWTDIVDLSVSPNHAVGLKKDGSVVASGENSAGQCDVAGW